MIFDQEHMSSYKHVYIGIYSINLKKICLEVFKILETLNM